MSETYYGQREYLRVRKFDLVLEDSYGNEYDGTGCFPCLPWCRKPVYTPGQHITGYLLIRPTRKFTITGVKILFEGIYRTEWCENNLKWVGHRAFYVDCVNLIQGRTMELECKWYRFDFEHVLPKNLIPSFKTRHCKIVYSATGLVTQINMPDLQTLETHFQIKGPMDIRNLPHTYHHPLSKSASKTYQITDTLRNSCATVAGDGSATENNPVIIKNQCPNSPSQDNNSFDDSFNDVHRVSASLWVNKQGFVAGDELVVEVYVDNGTPVAFETILCLQQVFILRPTYAFNRRTSEYVPVRTYPKKTVCNNIATLWQCDVTSLMAETNNVVYTMPTLQPNISNNVNNANASRNFASTKDPLIKIQYFIKLFICPRSTELVSDSKQQELISVELKLGNWDSGIHTLSTRTDSFQSHAHLSPRLHSGDPICGTSDMDLLNNDDNSGGDSNSVFEVNMLSMSTNGTCRYTPDTEGPPAYSDTGIYAEDIEEASTSSLQ